MPLQNFLSTLPWPLLDIITKVVGVLGSILIIYSVLLEKEKRRDAVFTVGAACLLVYSLTIGNKIFILFSAGAFLVSGWELVEIVRGKHQHSAELVEEYKNPKN